MGTTMFGSVDHPNDYILLLEKHHLNFKMHVDAAYGGFVYPFLAEKNTLSFYTNQNIVDGSGLSFNSADFQNALLRDSGQKTDSDT